MATTQPHNIAPVSRSGPPRSDGAEREEAVTSSKPADVSPASVGAPFEVLAVRCEQATGPDRALDELVSAATQDAVREIQSDGRTAYHSLDGGRWVSVQVRDYTASVDAALSLVPEELTFLLQHRFQSWHCEVGYGNAGNALLAPLAIAAASLRAKAQGKSA